MHIPRFNDSIDPAEVILHAVTFESSKDTIPARFHGTLRELLGIEHTIATCKDGAAFSPVIYKPGAYRGKDGVEAITAFGFDFDHLPNEVATDVLERASELAHASYTTYSNGQKADEVSFRIIFPMSRTITPDEHHRLWPLWSEWLWNRPDKMAQDAARLWFLPRTDQSRLAYAALTYHPGPLVNVDEMLSLAPASAPRAGRAIQVTATLPGGAIPEGTRHSSLLRMAGAMRRHGADVPAITAALLTHNEELCKPPLPHEEVVRIATSVTRYDPASPLVLAENTDLGNAERLITLTEGTLQYNRDEAVWVLWDGRRWKRITDDEVLAIGSQVSLELRALAESARNADQKDAADRLYTNALDLEDMRRIRGMTAGVKALAGIAGDRFDRNPMLLNVGNGTLDLTAGVLRAHDPTDWITRISDIDYSPEAPCHRWLAFLHEITGADGELIGYLQRVVGYTLTGSTEESVFFLLIGSGANGKTTFLEVVRGLMGEYGRAAEFSTFLKKVGDGPRNDLARLAGARFVSAAEADVGRSLSESVLKQLTGGDTVAARFLHKEFFEFKPELKLFLAANHLPSVTGTDEGTWRRIHVIPFSVHIPEAKRDPKLRSALLEELPGILNWAVEGVVAWKASGLGTPPAVREASAGYRADMDHLGTFLDECCVIAADASVAAGDLYNAYRDWSEDAGEPVPTKRSFGMNLRERGFTRIKSTNGVRKWGGVRLLAGGGRADGGASHPFARRDKPSSPAAMPQPSAKPKAEDAPPSATRHPNTETND